MMGITARQRRVRQAGLAILLAGLLVVISLAVLYWQALAKASGSGGYSCGPNVEEAVADAEGGDIIMVMDQISNAEDPIIVDKDITIKGGWSPKVGDCEPGPYDPEEKAFVFFNYNPTQRSPLPAPPDAPFINIEPVNMIAKIQQLEIDAVKVDVPDFSGDVIAGVISNGAQIFLENVVISNTGTTGALNLQVRGGSRLVISASQFIANSTNGVGGGFQIDVYDNSQVIIHNTQVLSNSAGTSGGGGQIFIHGSGRVTISNSSFIGNQTGTQGGGLEIRSDSSSGYVKIVNSLFARNTTGGNSSGAGLYINGGRVDIVHNTIAGVTTNPRQGIYVAGGTTRITNTIIANYATGLRRAGGTVTEDYNLYFNNTTHRSGTIGSGGHSLDGADPRFNNPAANNYHLRPTSAALDRGVNAGVTNDFDGDGRPQGASFDIGLDERVFNKLGPAIVAPGGLINYSLTVAQAGRSAKTITSALNSDNISVGGNQAATPYPSTLTPTGVSGAVTKVTVTLHNINYDYPHDLDILLVGPGPDGQQRKTLLMSDAGGDHILTDVSLMFDDTAGFLSDTDEIISGIYHPTNHPGSGDDIFPAPAPGGPYGTSLSVFNGANPNSSWSLYVVDDGEDASFGGDIFDGWTLALSTATGETITVTDTLPPGVTFANASGTGWACNHSNGVVSCSRSDSEPLTPPPIAISVTAPPTIGVLTNTANLSSNLPGLTANTAVVTTLVGLPNLSLSKSGPITAISGSLITYTLRVTNSGNIAATDLVMTDAIPAEASYISGGTKVGNVVSWTIPSLAANGGVTQTTFVVTATQPITNSDYRVSASEGVSTSGNVAVATIVGLPYLSLSKSGPVTATSGSLITYTLSVTNNGNITATDLVMTDAIPAGASYISGGTKVGNVVSWTIPSLAANGGVTHTTFVVTATQPITNSDYRVSASEGSSATGSAAVVTIIGLPYLSLSKSGPVTATSGSLITYTLTVTNSGNITANNLVMTDAIPAGASYISGGTKVGNVVSWTIPSLAANGGVTQTTFVVTATQPITNSDYRVSASEGSSATGSVVVVTTINLEEPSIYLPLIITN